MNFFRRRSIPSAETSQESAARAPSPPEPSTQVSPQLSSSSRSRLKRELAALHKEPPPGVMAYPSYGDDMSKIRAGIEGPEGSPFEKGIFIVAIQITSRYPFEPPRCRFITPVYHPNVDSKGRICLDTLKSPPAGSWNPAISLASLLLSLRLLMSEPNPEDGLEPSVSELYRRDPEQWQKEARLRTQKFASPAAVAKLRAKIEQLAEAKKKNPKQVKRPQTIGQKRPGKLTRPPLKRKKMETMPSSIKSNEQEKSPS